MGISSPVDPDLAAREPGHWSLAQTGQAEEWTVSWWQGWGVYGGDSRCALTGDQQPGEAVGGFRRSGVRYVTALGSFWLVLSRKREYKPGKLSLISQVLVIPGDCDEAYCVAPCLVPRESSPASHQRDPLAGARGRSSFSEQMAAQFCLQFCLQTWVGRGLLCPQCLMFLETCDPSHANRKPLPQAFD